ncbi:energy coupling factor transporter S component ThiW, partial [Flavonifractor sp. An112]|uniref:energy coupling factor transporter S component ThiW n=2 Tax=Flavonifractor TaxID=946234 RepID=UPI00174DD136
MRQQTAVKKLAIASLLTAVAVVGSLVSFPVLGSRCSPVQHMVNILCAVFLGPWYGVACAFAASFLRNLLGLGTLLAFPGSMVGALVCGLTYWGTRNLGATCVGEVFGTGILGGLAAWPIATLILGQSVAVYGYMGPFLISTVGGSIIAGAVL